MSALRLQAEPLTREGFARFGDVIEHHGKGRLINDGAIEQFHDLATLQCDSGGRVAVSVAVAREVPTWPLAVREMERHPLGSQAFVPLDGGAMVVVVADTAGPPARTDLRAFDCRPGQGVNYRRGIWHMPMVALNPQQRWLVIDRAGPGDNLEIVQLAEEVWLDGR